MIKSFLEIGNGEKCPYCDTIVDNRPDHKGEDITNHLLNKHQEETYKELFKETNIDDK